MITREGVRKALAQPDEVVAMTGKERLQRVQERLIAKGVLDVKLTLSEPWWSFCTRPHTEEEIDQLCGDWAELLEAHLDGRYRVVKEIGDAHK